MIIHDVFQPAQVSWWGSAVAKVHPVKVELFPKGCCLGEAVTGTEMLLGIRRMVPL